MFFLFFFCLLGKLIIIPFFLFHVTSIPNHPCNLRTYLSFYPLLVVLHLHVVLRLRVLAGMAQRGVIMVTEQNGLLMRQRLNADMVGVVLFFGCNIRRHLIVRPFTLANY